MHSNVGQILGLKGDFRGALLHHQCALQITRTLSISEQNGLHTIFNNMGDICVRQAESQALKRTDVELQSIATYHNNIGGVLKLLHHRDELAATYNNIGSISFHLKDYDTALLNYQKCLAIQRRSLPSKHPLISDTCCNIAMVYDAQSNYIEATRYIKEAETFS